MVSSHFVVTHRYSSRLRSTPASVKPDRTANSTPADAAFLVSASAAIVITPTSVSVCVLPPDATGSLVMVCTSSLGAARGDICGADGIGASDSALVSEVVVVGTTVMLALAVLVVTELSTTVVVAVPPTTLVVVDVGLGANVVVVVVEPLGTVVVDCATVVVVVGEAIDVVVVAGTTMSADTSTSSMCRYPATEEPDPTNLTAVLLAM